MLKLDGYKNTLLERCKAYADAGRQLSLAGSDMAGEFLTFYSSHQERTDSAQNAVDFANAFGDASTAAWRTNFQSQVLRRFEQWTDLIESARQLCVFHTIFYCVVIVAIVMFVIILFSFQNWFWLWFWCVFVR